MIRAEIFREYDVRGIVGQTLHESDAMSIGRAFGQTVRRLEKNGKSENEKTGDVNRTVVVARDGRISSPALQKNLSKGIQSTGVQVIDIGVGPTPMLYFAVHHLSADAGVMVTGSHNPPDYNGFKFMRQRMTLFGPYIQEMYQIIDSGLADAVFLEKSIQSVRVLDAYIDRLLRDMGSLLPMNVVWDAGHGATGEVLEHLADRLNSQYGGRHEVLYGQIDGNFPAHHPDPTIPDNLKDLIDRVRQSGADLGIALDGDGDRLGVVDHTGQIWWADELMMLWGQDILKRMPGASIVADVKSSDALFEHIQHCGGQPVLWKTGHSLIKHKMQEMGAPLAGEMSGHIFFGDDYEGFDDGIYAGLRLLKLLCQSSNNKFLLHELRQTLPTRCNTREIRIECAHVDRYALIDEIKRKLSLEADVSVNALDGLRVHYPYGWWLLRASNTQDMLVARCEAKSAADLERILTKLYGYLKDYDIQTDGLFS